VSCQGILYPVGVLTESIKEHPLNLEIASYIANLPSGVILHPLKFLGC